MKVMIVDVLTGQIAGKMEEGILLTTPRYEKYEEPVVELEPKKPSYSEMKKVAKGKGLEFKGNIKKAELEDLIKGE